MHIWAMHVWSKLSCVPVRSGSCWLTLGLQWCLFRAVDRHRHPFISIACRQSAVRY